MDPVARRHAARRNCLRSVEKISLRKVCREYPRPDGTSLQVLHGIDFAVEAGSFNAILGPSGCGKSTILNLIAGLDRCSSGEILFDGRTLASGSSRPEIGFVFQRPLLLNWRTVADNVALPLERIERDRAARRERAKRYLDLVGLGAFEEYFPLQLSGGMQQRVAIARALAVEPDVLLMDEPFSGLDEFTARKLREELLQIWTKTRKTILFVTHSIGESVFLSQQILIVSQKPATILKRVSVDLPYPREYGDLKLFEIERDLTRDFLSMNA
jgi:NitT/TauT family transport system ATP-binding protein